MEDLKIEVQSYNVIGGGKIYFGEVHSAIGPVYLSGNFSNHSDAVSDCQSWIDAQKRDAVLHMERISEHEKRFQVGEFTVSIYAVPILQGKHEYFGDVRRKNEPFPALFTSGMLSKEEDAANDCRLWAETKQEELMKNSRAGAVYSVELLLVITVMILMVATGLFTLKDTVADQFKETGNLLQNVQKKSLPPMPIRKEEEAKIQEIRPLVP